MSGVSIQYTGTIPNVFTLSGSELRTVDIIQQINPISEQLPSNVVDFTIDSAREIGTMFEENKPVDVYFNGEIKQRAFIKEVNRISKTQWKVKSVDYIGLMGTIPFYGGMYENYSAQTLFRDIFTAAGVPYQLDDQYFFEQLITGYIPFCTCREALQQVAFATNGEVHTDGRKNVYVTRPPSTISQTIPLDRIMQGQSFQNKPTISSVTLTAHEYKKIEDTLGAYTQFNDTAKSNIFIRFPEPLHDLAIGGGTIKESGANYAIIDANAHTGCTLRGKKYSHTTLTKKIVNMAAENNGYKSDKKITKATLVNSKNIDNLLQNVYNEGIKTKAVNLKIVESKHLDESTTPPTIVYDEPTSVGQKIKCKTEYLGEKQGYIIEQRYNLNGNIIVKDTTLQED